ncbi:clavaminate synthase-like protein [Citrus sinensis]|uniref:Clavaminate synthase-like protein n=1 Tax=Citrus sinensis TaxID=2711 RepID=A0ACB8J958_CITSI|nr:clavaminate synthase-like protein [Citrus sinensis]
MRNGHGEKSVWRRSSRAHSLRFWGQSSAVVPGQIQDLGLLATPMLLKNEQKAPKFYCYYFCYYFFRAEATPFSIETIAFTTTLDEFEAFSMETRASCGETHGERERKSTVKTEHGEKRESGGGESQQREHRELAQNAAFCANCGSHCGAVLLRGFDVKTANDFNDVVEAFGYEELPYVGGAAPRSHVVGRVFTANESSLDRNIPFHQEMALLPQFPSKLFFFCEVEPVSGGETPIVLSHIVYERMKQSYPEFVQQLEQDGLIYTRIYQEKDDLTSPTGRGWKSIFLTEDKSLAEERSIIHEQQVSIASKPKSQFGLRAANLGLKLEWMEDGGVKTVLGPIPAVTYDKIRQRKIWFNSIVMAYTCWKDTQNDPVKAVTFGNGSPLPEDIVYDCMKILEEECVAIPWQNGDVLLIDNLAVLHARRSSSRPRHILASLCK